jgi:hypothetical protein
VSDARRLKSLEDENVKLKKLLAQAMLDNAMLKDVAASAKLLIKTIAILREADAGVKTTELCRKYGISSATVYIHGLLPLCKHLPPIADQDECVRLFGVSRRSRQRPEIRIEG